MSTYDSYDWTGRRPPFIPNIDIRDNYFGHIPFKPVKTEKQLLLEQVVNKIKSTTSGVNREYIDGPYSVRINDVVITSQFVKQSITRYDTHDPLRYQTTIGDEVVTDRYGTIYFALSTKYNSQQQEVELSSLRKIVAKLG